MYDPAPAEDATPAATAAANDVRRLGPAARAELRRDLVAQAYKIRQENPDLSIAEIAQRLGRSPSTVAKYFTDPTASKARERKHAYRGTCATEGCENPTSAGDGRGRARERCRSCENSGRRVHTEDSVIDVLRRFEAETGRRARSSDFHPTRARAGGDAAWERYQRYGLALATIRRIFTGGFPAAAAAAHDVQRSVVTEHDEPTPAHDGEDHGWHEHHEARPHEHDGPSGPDELAWAA